MSQDYNERIAFHYRAYRPPLHSKILKANLGNRSFKSGLDIGCGTGQSSIAMRTYAKSVVGIDISASMLEHANKQAGISYELFDGTQLDYPTGSFDIIGFAGSLNYVNQELLVPQLQYVGVSNASVVVYDFDIDLSEYLSVLDIKMWPADYYDHDLALSEGTNFRLVQHQMTKEVVRVTVPDIGHLLMSDGWIVDQLPAGTTHQKMCAQLKALSPIQAVDEMRSLEVTTYFREYQIANH